MEKTRDEFTSLLVSYKKIKAHDITVVFDGHKNGTGTENTEVRGGIKVIYSRLGECADEVIKRIISKERREWIVVSSDRHIVNHAWAVSSIPVPSGRFFEAVSKQVRTGAHPENPEPAGEDDKDAYDADAFKSHRKGTHHQLSKKERAVRKALSKL